MGIGGCFDDEEEALIWEGLEEGGIVVPYYDADDPVKNDDLIVIYTPMPDGHWRMNITCRSYFANASSLLSAPAKSGNTPADEEEDAFLRRIRAM